METKIQKFVDQLNEKFGGPQYEGDKAPVVFSYMEGKKYFRIVRQTNQRSVYCFVNQEGDILFANGWKAPAKGASAKRGHIDNPFDDCCYSNGVKYLRGGCMFH